MVFLKIVLPFNIRACLCVSVLRRAPTTESYAAFTKACVLKLVFKINFDYCFRLSTSRFFCQTTIHSCLL